MDEAAAVGRHRLMAGGERSDRQPPVSESDSSGFVEPDVAIVRTGDAAATRIFVRESLANRHGCAAAIVTVGIEAEKSSQSA